MHDPLFYHIMQNDANNKLIKPIKLKKKSKTKTKKKSKSSFLSRIYKFLIE